VMFLVHPTLTEAEVAKTCEAIKAVMSEASHVS
jgi:ribosomal protein S6